MVRTDRRMRLGRSSTGLHFSAGETMGSTQETTFKETIPILFSKRWAFLLITGPTLTNVMDLRLILVR